MDFAEGRFVLADVLLQDVEERLGLLRAQVNALKVLDIDQVGGVLGDETEHEEEIPEVGANLNGVGVAFAVVGTVDQMDFGGVVGIHNEKGARARSLAFL